jgi:tetrahydrodipicolinate N-succinyltransferase
VLAHPHVVDPWLSTARVVIVKRVDERTRAKTSINELLRD